MLKKIRAILPSYTYEIIIGIIKDNGLEEREKSMSEQLKNTTDFEIAISIADDTPSSILAEITRRAVEEKLSEDEITFFLGEKLRIDKERAEILMFELKKKLIFFTEAVEIKEESDDKSEPTAENKEVKSEKKEKKKEEEKNNKKLKVDPYRELID